MPVIRWHLVCPHRQVDVDLARTRLMNTEILSGQRGQYEGAPKLRLQFLSPKARITPGTPRRTTAWSCPGARRRRVSQPSYTWPLAPKVAGVKVGGAAVTRLSRAAKNSSLAWTTPPPSSRDARSGRSVPAMPSTPPVLSVRPVPSVLPAPAVLPVPSVTGRRQRVPAGSARLLMVTIGAPFDAFSRELAARGIQSKRYFHPPLHLQPVFSRHPCRRSAKLVESERASAEALALPLFAHMTDEDFETVCRAMGGRWVNHFRFTDHVGRAVFAADATVVDRYNRGLVSADRPVAEPPGDRRVSDMAETYDHAGKPVRHARARVNGIRMHYWRTGGAGKVPLVLAHGSSDDGLCWTNLAKELENSFDIVMIDAVGLDRLFKRLGDVPYSLRVVGAASGAPPTLARVMPCTASSRPRSSADGSTPRSYWSLSAASAPSASPASIRPSSARTATNALVRHILTTAATGVRQVLAATGVGERIFPVALQRF